MEIIFSRFGKIKSCEIVKDWKTGDSLQYGFIEFEISDKINFHPIFHFVDSQKITYEKNSKIEKLKKVLNGFQL